MNKCNHPNIDTALITPHQPVSREGDTSPTHPLRFFARFCVRSKNRKGCNIRAEMFWDDQRAAIIVIIPAFVHFKGKSSR